MKTRLILIVAILLISTSTLVYSLIAYSDTGWTSSSGLNSYGGKAYNVTDFGGGYTFFCAGTGTCYMIIGNTLIINEGSGADGLFFTVTPN